MEQEIKRHRDLVMALANKKRLSEIDKKLAMIESTFKINYGYWLKGMIDDSSSSATPDSKVTRSKTSRVETRPDLPEQPIRGFVNESLFLKNFLLKGKGSEEFKTLAIVGKFGVGKTTLCQDVFNDKDVKEAYLPRVWVSMYSEETREEGDQKVAVLKRILRSLGVEDEALDSIRTEADEEKRKNAEEGRRDEETVKEKELFRLLNALNSNLFGKRYLIVLDDVWEDNEWSQRLDGEETQQEKTHLSCGFPKGSGGRVIVTSRDEGLAKKIVGEEENVQRLFPRSDVESVWEIYKDAFGEPMKDENGEVVKDAAGEPMKDAVEKHVIGEDGRPTKWVVNPRYPGRYKKELMDKSGGVPWAAQMLAKIEPLKNDEDKDM
ncbi:probable disease resistance protein At4g19060 [Brassica rapa]|nr:probable disease resistance protein At4g19060 [Brassica rapa]